MAIDPRLRALRILRDLELIRCGAGRADFGGLVSEGLAEVERVLNRDLYWYHYRLNMRGQALVEHMWP